MRKPKKSGKTTSLMDAHFLNKAECLLARQRDLWSVNMDQGKACCAGPAESGARGRKSSGPTAAQGPMGDTARWLSRTPLPAGRTAESCGTANCTDGEAAEVMEASGRPGFDDVLWSKASRAPECVTHSAHPLGSQAC